MDLKDYDNDFLSKLYSTMFKIRRFEEEVFELYKQGLMPGLAHLYLGEEAVATGACAALKDIDFITSTHRGHGHLIARGADVRRMMAEILGKKDGYCKGKGGSMHIVDYDKKILGANGIVGAGIPIATGAAYMSKMKKTNQVTLCFFGDGASNQGTFHESINMASAWKLPVVYLVENNLFGISVDVRKVTNVEDLSVRAKGYGINGITVDGNDVLKVYEATKDAIEFARKGGGPTLVECKTYRTQGHHVGDPASYRQREEEKHWKSLDPIILFKNQLTENHIFSEQEIDEIEKQIDDEIMEAVKFAKDSPYPDPIEAYDDLYV